MIPRPSPTALTLRRFGPTAGALSPRHFYSDRSGGLPYAAPAEGAGRKPSTPSANIQASGITGLFVRPFHTKRSSR